jgi:hypothetical protein
VFAFAYRLPDATALINDHFMHVAWGRQLLWGRLPVRDSVPLGMPLQTGLSAAAEWLIGYRLLSEALIISAAFAAAAVLTFVLVYRATARLAIAAGAALLEVAIAPRTYSYPKLVVYAAGIWLLWQYIDHPSLRRAVYLGAATALAFYLRHDHGVYLGLATVCVIAVRHGHAIREGVQRNAAFATTCAVLVLPFFGYVEAYGSVREYVRDLRQFSAREQSGNPFVWPAWPLTSFESVARWTTPDDRSVQVNIRWSAAASDDRRRQAAARYQLHGHSPGTVESGRFTLSDTSTANGRAIINDPAIEDTSGIDRLTGNVYTVGWYVGPLRLLTGLDTARGSAALLFFVFLALPAAAAVALVRNRLAPGPLGRWERLKIAAVGLVAVITFAGFVRDALDVRIADAVVAPLLLGAWLSARWISGGRPWTWNRAVRVAVLVIALIPVTRSIVVAGAVEPRIERAEPFAVTWKRLTASPPFNEWAARGGAEYRVVHYVRECTAAHEPLLVLSPAPQIYYYANRPFAGRMGWYMEGYYSSELNQRENARALERDRPSVAIIDAGRESRDLATHPSALHYVTQHYHPVGELAAADGTILRVLARNDRRPTGTFSDAGWPCYR